MFSGNVIDRYYLFKSSFHGIEKCELYANFRRNNRKYAEGIDNIKVYIYTQNKYYIV